MYRCVNVQDPKGRHTIKLAAALLLFLPPLTVAQTQTSVDGKWKVVSTIAGNESTVDCTIKQTGADLSGTCTGQQGDVKITGKVDGATVTWSYTSEYNGTELSIKYSGKLADGKITGDATVDPFGVSGDFTATPEKESN